MNCHICRRPIEWVGGALCSASHGKQKIDIYEMVDRWHEGEFDGTLPQFLQWTWDEYSHWIDTGRMPEREYG